MAEIGNVTVRVDAVITDEQYREAMGAVRAANERMDLLVAENAKLRHDLEEANNQAEEVCIENAKLRWLVQKMMRFFEDGDYCTTCEKAAECDAQEEYEEDCLMRGVFHDRMRELGVEP